MTSSRLVILLVLASVVGCSSAAGSRGVEFLDDSRPLDFGPVAYGSRPVDVAFGAWFAGDVGAADVAFSALADDSALSLLGKAEWQTLRGDFEGAAAAYALFFEGHMDNPLADFAAVRLESLLPLISDELLLSGVATADWGPLSASARIGLTRVAAKLDAERNQRAGGRSELVRFGQLEQWAWAGPFGFYENSQFEVVYPPETQPELEQHTQYQNRSVPRWEQQFEDFVSPSWPSGGVYYFESFFEADGNDPFTVTFRGSGSTTVWIDGEEILERHNWEALAPHQISRVVALNPGRHRTLVKYAVGNRNDPGFQLMLTPTTGKAPPYAIRAVEPGATTGVEPSVFLRGRGPLPDDLTLIAGDPFYLWLAAYFALEVGEFSRGRFALQLAMPLAETFDCLHLAEGELSQTDGELDPTLATNLSIASFLRALEIDPLAGLPRLMLGRILYDQGQIEEALQHFDLLASAYPESFRPNYFRYLILSDLGWLAPAELALRKAAQDKPTSCTIATNIADQELAVGRYPTPESVAQRPSVCTSVDDLLIDFHYVPSGKVKEALELAQELERRDPTSNEYRITIASLLAHLGRVDEAIAEYALAESDDTSDAPLFVEERVDLLLAANRGDEAKALLEDALVRDPSNIAYHELMRRFGGEGILADLRVDGLGVVAEHLASGQDTKQSAFYLLDYAAFRYFRDGSSLSVTHQIIRVLNKDAKNQHGEVKIPVGAIVLNLRTIKADGVTTVDPEVIPNKNSISMPNLEIGDFIEFEYITASRPRVDGTPSFRAPRWYFQIYEAPLMYSELVVEVPAELEIQIDIRGPVPPPTITEHDAFKRYTYLMTEMMVPRPEPGAPNSLEIVPSVQLGYDIDIEPLRDGIRNSVLATTVPSDSLRDALELGRAGATEPREIAKRLFRFVKAEITEDADTYFGSPASWVWTSRSGSRMALLTTLLEMAGVPCEVVILKPFGAPEQDNAVPDLSNYTQVVLRVDTGDEQMVWLDPTQTHAKFDYLPPELQGRPGLVLSPAGEWTVSRSYDPEINRQHLEFELLIGEDGAVNGVGRERSDGVHGTRLRNFVGRFRSDPDEINSRLSEYLVRYFGDVRVTHHDFSDVESDGPVTLAYDFEASNFARVTNAGLDIRTTVFADELLQRFATLPSRTQDLLVPFPTNTELDIVISLPSGLTLSSLPENVEIVTAFGTYRRTVEANEQDVHLVERLDLPMQRVTPAQYTDFQDFCRQVDNAQIIQLSGRP